jgi:hypothetical protein
VIDAAQLSVCKCVVRSDAAILAAQWRGHLAADFAADNVATGEDVRHVCPQEFIDTDLTFIAKFDVGLFDSDSVGVRATARRDQEPLSAQPARVIASLDLDDDFRSILSHRTRGCAGHDLDSFSGKDFADGLAYLGLITVCEQLLAALQNGDFSAEALKHLPKLQRDIASA